LFTPNGIGRDALQKAVAEHDGNAAFDKIGNESLISADRRYDDSIDPLLQDKLECAALVFVVFFSVAEQQIVFLALGVGRFLDPPHKFGEERIGDVRNQHRDRPGLTDAQTAGDAVGSIFQRGDRFEDPFPAFSAHGARFVDDMGDRRRRYACPVGNVFHSRHRALRVRS
jgi:hypothetical protein